MFWAGLSFFALVRGGFNSGDSPFISSCNGRRVASSIFRSGVGRRFPGSDCTACSGPKTCYPPHCIPSLSPFVAGRKSPGHSGRYAKIPASAPAIHPAAPFVDAVWCSLQQPCESLTRPKRPYLWLRQSLTRALKPMHQPVYGSISRFNRSPRLRNRSLKPQNRCNSRKNSCQGPFSRKNH